MIDVLLPYYGDPALMRTAVASVQAQDDPDWRLRVVDDAYPDASVSTWVATLGDPRISVERRSRQGGVNVVFSHCLSLAEADLVTFMGCDDVMHPSHLRHCRELFARHADATFVQPGVRVIDDGGTPVRPLADRVKSALRPRGHQVLEGEPLARSLLRGNWLYFPSIVWRRDAIAAIGFRPGLETLLDLQLELDLVLGGARLVVDEQVTFDYRRHGASASSRTARSAERFTEGEAFFAAAAASCAERGWPRAARAARWHSTTRLHAAATAVGAALQR